MKKVNNRTSVERPPSFASLNCLISWICVRGDFEAADKKAEKISEKLHGWRRYTSKYTDEGRAMMFIMSLALLPVYYYGAKYLIQRRKKVKNTEMTDNTKNTE